jgi:FkbM family methyltransferase
VRVKLPSVADRIWVDFDFAVLNSQPVDDPLLTALLAHIKPGSKVFDVGSFVGTYAVAAARRMSTGQVIAFEPSPESAGLLRRHSLLNGVENRIRVVEAACSNRNGIEVMSVWPVLTTTWGSGNALRNVYPREEADPTMVPVCTVRLDDYVQAGKDVPSILKIDVEGAELWVLEGAMEVLRVHRPLVLLEIHKVIWHMFDTTEERVRALIASVGYDLLEITPPYRPLHEFPEYGHALLRPRN